MARVWTEEQRQKARERALARLAKPEAADLAAPAAEDEQHFSPPQADPGAIDQYEVYLASIDAETKELLGPERLRLAYQAGLAKARQEKVAAAEKRLAEKALHHAKVEEGLLPQSAQDEAVRQRRMNELVETIIELPPTGPNGEIPDIGLRVDGKILLHGQRRTMTRAQFDSVRETLYRVGENELLFKGQNRRQRQWLMGRAIGGGNNHIELDGEGRPV